MSTTLSIKKGLLEEAKKLSGANTKRETVEIALKEFVRREKIKKTDWTGGQSRYFFNTFHVT